MSKKKALGRGLSALLSDTPGGDDERLETDVPVANVNAPQQTVVGNLNEIPLGEIEVNPFQPRQDFNQEHLQELSESIKVHGIIQPITVRRLSKNQYQLISGERRFQASKLAGLAMIPAYIRSADDQQMLEMALIENIQRENLNPIEIALSYQRLITEIGLKQEELGDRVGKNRTTVTNYLRLLKLPPDIQAALRDNRISMGHARAIVSVENPDSQLFIFKKMISEDLSVRKVEELAREVSGGVKEETKS
ncbi:MAG TPA: ParB/RepB/Spo0J family partition protein, partial [Cyclobacteriaceae bacterium]